MKTLKRMLCVISIFVFAICNAAAEHTDLKWGMSQKETWAILSPDYEYISVGGMTPYWKNVKISKYKADMYLGFKKDQLYEKKFEFYDDNKNQTIFKTLNTAFQKKYGKPQEDSSKWNLKNWKECRETARFALSVFFGWHIDEMPDDFLDKDFKNGFQKKRVFIKIWEPDDETYIALTNLLNMDVYPSHTRVTYLRKEYVYNNNDLEGI